MTFFMQRRRQRMIDNENFEIYKQELKEKYPIMETAVSLGLLNSPRGGTTAVKCVFHEPDRTPSMVLMENANRFECKSCGAKGDVFNLVGKKIFEDANNFKEAVDWLEGKPASFQKIQNIDVSNLRNKSEKIIYIRQTYFNEHGISQEFQQKFNLYLGNFNGIPSAVIPNDKGEHHRIFLAGVGKFKTKGKVSLFKAGSRKSNVRFLAEGELKAILIYQKTGLSCMSGTGGCMTFNDDWIKEFDGAESIFIIYDNDKEGKAGAEIAAKKLGFDRCLIVDIPKEVGKDITDFFQVGKTKEDFMQLLGEARQLGEAPSANAINLESDELEDALKEDQSKYFKVQTGLELLDGAVKGGFRSGALYMISAPEKAGKTSLVMQMLVNQLKAGQKVSYIDTEIGKHDFLKRATAIEFGITVSEAEKDVDKQKQFYEKYKATLLYLSRERLKNTNYDVGIFQTTLENLADKGYKIVFVDNFTKFFLSPEAKLKGWEKLGKALDATDAVVKDKNILVFGVLHLKSNDLKERMSPKKIKDILSDPELIFKNSVEIIHRPSLAAMYGGSATLSQISGGIIHLWRPFQNYSSKEYQKLACLILESFREGTNYEEIRMKFDPENRIFIDEKINPAYTDSEGNEYLQTGEYAENSIKPYYQTD